ncbi:galactose oxidase [Parvularcula flava]|uniref:Galactose oxidase n=1 Tax=Aquisalinus luteolus TaxID=1566827 RepID=A0ABX0HMU8_9PROT|nr:kelch repeat-containing protein [Aquisalinus luteolus]NHK28876.1 galactose oxidase [Aquisalinus luteolus]
MADDRSMPTRRAMLAGTGAVIAMGSIARAQEGQPLPPPWRAVTPLPLAVQEIYPAVHQGRIHLAGGIMAEGGEIIGATARHVSWQPGEESWRAEAPLPSARHHPNLVSAGGRLMSLGGFLTRTGGLDWTITAETLAFDAENESWTEGPPAPEAHGETVCVTVGSHVHVIGGRAPRGDSNLTWNDHTDSDRHLVLDAKSGRWERAAPAPTKRNSAAGALLDGAVHVVGGRTVEGGNVRVHEVWDTAEDRWRTAAPMPEVPHGGQGGLAAAVIGGKLVAMGGEYFTDGGGVYPNVWIYDPSTDEWQAGPSMLTPRHGLGGVSIGQTLYAIGGAVQAGGNSTSTLVEALTL